MQGFWRSSSSIIVAAVVGMVTISFLSSFPAQGAEPEGGSKSKVIKARSFVIRDAEGRERACLRFAPRDKAAPKYSSPVLQLLGTDGQVRFEFGVDDQRDATVLRMLRADGQIAIVLASDKDGNVVAFEPRASKPPAILVQTQHLAEGRGSLSLFGLFNPQGIAQAVLAVPPDDSPGMRLYDAAGQPYGFEKVPPPPQAKPPSWLAQAPIRPAAPASQPGAMDAQVLEAEVFLLLDDQNRVRAGFGLTSGDGISLNGAALILYDAAETIRGAMRYREDEKYASLLFADLTGYSALEAHVSPQGPFLQLYSPPENKSILISLSKPAPARLVGAGGVSLNGEDGNPRIIFGEFARDGGGGLGVQDTEGAQDSTGQKSLLLVR